MSHQVDVCRLMSKGLRGLLVYHPMGSGKTISALSAARTLLRSGAVTKVVILVSKSVMAQWNAQLHRVGIVKSPVTIDTHRRWLDDYGEVRRVV
jgi:superfamily II DNA or RNA helicase